MIYSGPEAAAGKGETNLLVGRTHDIAKALPGSIAVKTGHVALNVNLARGIPTGERSPNPIPPLAVFACKAFVTEKCPGKSCPSRLLGVTDTD
jgi:hypothetical protein